MPTALTPVLVLQHIPAEDARFRTRPFSWCCVSRSASRTAIRPVSQFASHTKPNARKEWSSKCWFYWL